MRVRLSMEEPLNPFEACDEEWTPSRLGWLSPRVSFSEDLCTQDRFSPEKRKSEQTFEDDYSSEFEFSNLASVDLPSEEGMLFADELFLDGKLCAAARLHDRQQVLKIEKEEEDRFEEEDWPLWRQQLRNFNENPRCTSMTIAGARGNPHRSCISLTNSRCPSPSRSFSLPATVPTSPKAPSKYSNKLKDLFKPKKLRLPSSSKEMPSSRESSVSSSCRLPISPRSFWPFSRSNSAGEKKSPPAVSLPPRRSNSSGESKTSSSTSKCDAESKSKAGTSTVSFAELQTPQCSQVKKGLPPLPALNIKKSSGSHSFLAPLSCGADAVAQSSQPASLANQVHSAPPCSRPISNRSALPPNNGIHISRTASDVATRLITNNCHLDAAATGSSSGGHYQTIHDYSSTTARARSSSSPGRPTRRDPGHSFNQSSPLKRDVWTSPGRGNLERGTVKNLGRGSIGPKGLVRPQDIRSREGWQGSDRHIVYSTSVRVMPVLNVPVCMGPSLRGAKASSKSKLHRLGSFFAKKEKGGDCVMLPDSQCGA